MKNEVLKKYVSPTVVILISGFLGSIKALLDSLGYHIISDDAVSAAVSFICWSIAIGTAAYKVYVSKTIKSRQKRKKKA